MTQTWQKPPTTVWVITNCTRRTFCGLVIITLDLDATISHIPCEGIRFRSQMALQIPSGSQCALPIRSQARGNVALAVGYATGRASGIKSWPNHLVMCDTWAIHEPCLSNASAKLRHFWVNLYLCPTIHRLWTEFGLLLDQMLYLSGS